MFTDIVPEVKKLLADFVEAKSRRSGPARP
jgi:hypothetical protein